MPWVLRFPPTPGTTGGYFDGAGSVPAPLQEAFVYPHSERRLAEAQANSSRAAGGPRLEVVEARLCPTTGTGADTGTDTGGPGRVLCALQQPAAPILRVQVEPRVWAAAEAYVYASEDPGTYDSDPQRFEADVQHVLHNLRPADGGIPTVESARRVLEGNKGLAEAGLAALRFAGRAGALEDGDEGRPL